METGQVTFHNNKKVKRIFVEKRINEVVNRLNKTKVERHPDLMLEKIQREKLDRMSARQQEFAEVRWINFSSFNSLLTYPYIFLERKGSSFS
jgi:uncharacterized protein (UPF0305 family)